MERCFGVNGQGRPLLSPTGTPSIPSQRWAKLVPGAGWLTAGALLMWNISMTNSAIRVEDTNFNNAKSLYLKNIEKLPLVDCTAGNKTFDIDVPPSGHYYEIERCPGYVARLALVATRRDNDSQEATQSFMNSAGLRVIDENFVLINSDVGSPVVTDQPRVRYFARPGRLRFICFFLTDGTTTTGCPAWIIRPYITENMVAMLVMKAVSRGVKLREYPQLDRPAGKDSIPVPPSVKLRVTLQQSTMETDANPGPDAADSNIIH